MLCAYTAFCCNLTKPESIILQRKEKKIDLKCDYKDYDNLVYHPKTVKHKRSIAFLLKAFQPACIKHLSIQVRTCAYIYSFSRSQTFYQLEIIESCLFLIIMALGRVCAVRVYILHTFWFNELQNGVCAQHMINGSFSEPSNLLLMEYFM